MLPVCYGRAMKRDIKLILWILQHMEEKDTENYTPAPRFELV